MSTFSLLSSESVVSTGSLRASVTPTGAVNGSTQAGGVLLYGQTEASADADGVIAITDMMLRAAPNTYSLTVSLPDYTQTQVLSAFAGGAI